MIKKRYILNFPPDSGDKPLSYHLVRDYDIRINILKAEVYPGKRGSLLLELQGKKENIEKGVEYLHSRMLSANRSTIASILGRKSIDCGNCTAFVLRCVDHETRIVEKEFDKKKCVVCELCIPPARSIF
jgi:Pyruvate/2-oxoacid:ferredoxin oxidoreductase delta subunit